MLLDWYARARADPPLADGPLALPGRRQRVHAAADPSRACRSRVRTVRRGVRSFAELAAAEQATSCGPGRAGVQRAGGTPPPARARRCARSTAACCPTGSTRSAASPASAPTRRPRFARSPSTRRVAVDTNVRRVVQRVRFGPRIRARRQRSALDAAAAELLPAGRAQRHELGLMDLGAAICTARAPKCLVCPLRSECAAFPLDPATLAERARADGVSPRSLRIEERRATCAAA